MNTYVYQLGDALYVNLTNQCTNRCEFCVRNEEKGVGPYDLWLDKEPTAQEVLKAMGDPVQYSEVVFCGYGEPMIRMEEIVEISREIKKRGGKVRINTNGHANLYHHRNVVPELEGLADAVSISLNAPTAQRYREICQPDHGEEAFEALLDFAAECVKHIPEVTLSVVDILSPEEIEKCRSIAEAIGTRFRVRRTL